MQLFKKFIILVLPLFLLWSLMLFITRGEITREDVNVFAWFGNVNTLEFENMLDKFQYVVDTLKSSFFGSVSLIKANALNIYNANNIITIVKSIAQILLNVFNIFTLPMALFVNILVLGWQFTYSAIMNLWQFIKFFYAPIVTALT